MRTVLWSRLRHQRRSAAAVAVAVVIAVAFVAAVLGATASLTRFVEDAAAPRARTADLVVAPGTTSSGARLPFGDAETAALRAVRGVALVSPVRAAHLPVGWPDGRAYAEVGSLPEDPRLAWFRVVAGRLPGSDGEVLLDAATAARLGIAVGDRLPLEVDDPAGTTSPAVPGGAVVAGTMRPTGPSLPGRTLLARGSAVDRWQAASGTEPEDRIHELAVLVSPDADLAAVVAAAGAALPLHEVRTGPQAATAAAADVTRDTDVLGRLLLGFTAIALVVATIVVANTFAIMFAQRSRGLALLRCVGATRRQLVRAARAEALAVGLVASVAGALLGNGLVLAAVALLPHLVPVTTGAQAVLGVWSWLLPVGAGVVVTVLAALAPARRATRVAPLAALRPDPAAVRRRTSRVRLAVGTLAAVVGTAAVGGAITVGDGPGVLLGVLGGSLVVIGVVLLSPVVVPVVTRLIGGPVGLVGPVARIAVANTTRNPARSAATSTALFIGVCLISVLSVGSATVSRAVADEIAASRPVDLVVAAGQPGAGAQPLTPVGTEGAAPAGLDPGMLRALAALPGTVAVAGLRQVTATLPGARAGSDVGSDAGSEPGSEPVRLVGGDVAALRAVYRAALPLDDATLLAPSWAWDRLGASGSRTAVTVGGRTVTLTVRRIGGLETFMVSAATLDRLGAGPQVGTAWLRAADGQDAGDYRSAVQSALPRVGPTVAGGGIDERARVETALRVLLGVAGGLLGVSVLISLVGVGNTLALSVHERARESAVQRAVGMTRRQLRAGLAVEAGLLAVVGCVVGVVVGGLLGWAGAAVLAAGVAPVGAPVVPWAALATVLAVAVAAAVLASVLPGRRAARVSPTQALAQA